MYRPSCYEGRLQHLVYTTLCSSGPRWRCSMAGRSITAQYQQLLLLTISGRAVTSITILNVAVIEGGVHHKALYIGVPVSFSP